jgi:hypothetical protein
MVSGYTFATGKGPGDSGDVNKSVREKIATAIEAADINGKGEVVVKFGVTEKNNLQILTVESNDKYLSREVKEALAGTTIAFPKGSAGVYKIKVHVNEAVELPYNDIRDQVFQAVQNIEATSSESVDLKLRVVSPETVMVLKAESKDAELAEKVKQTLEKEGVQIPQNLNGDYNLTVSFQ